MLNKLLKRCMPWMDKGRWYKISIIGDSLDTAHIDHDPIFKETTLDGPILYVGIDFNLKVQIIDVKFVPANDYLTNGTTIAIREMEDGAFQVTGYTSPGTIWIFMKVG